MYQDFIKKNYFLVEYEVIPESITRHYRNYETLKITALIKKVK